MRGYAGSGKSTKAAEIAKKTGAVVVCRDDLRKMLLGSFWTGVKEDEDRVTVAEESQVKALLLSGTSVVVDATHLNPPYLRKWAKLATRLGVGFDVVDVRVDPWECQVRDAHRDRKVGAAVIQSQAKRWPMEKWPTITAKPFLIEPVQWDDSLPDAIIVDIDGTLAHMTGRSPYDYHRVHEDRVDGIIRDLVKSWATYEPDGVDRAAQVLIVSGRDDDCRDMTEKWLRDNWVWYNHLFMRPADAVDERGGKLPDYMVKYDLFNKHIRGKFNVEFVLDDRQQVVDTWRQLGLKCLQVAPGDF